MNLLFTLVVCLPVFPVTSLPQALFTTNSRPLISPQTSQHVRELISKWNSSGLAVGVIQKDPTAPNGWRSELAGYGVARQDGSQVTPDTIFAIGSNSKLFTAVSIGLLIENATLAKERGQELSWTTRMSDLIPEWGLMDETASGHATIQDLLSHRTGVPGHGLASFKRKGGIRELISKLRYLRPSSEFRETYQYNNLMYEALSYLPQLLLNQSYDSYVDQHIFQPLGMVSSTLSVAAAEKSGKLAHGYQWDSQDFSTGTMGTLLPTIPFSTRPGDEDIAMGATGVLTSARDLTLWLSMLMNNGKHPYTNQTVIPESVIDHITYGRAVSAGAPTYPEHSPIVYGAAQMRYSYQGHEIIEHGGSDAGFISQISRFPQDGLGVFLMSNDGSGKFVSESTKWRIVEELLELKQVDWSQRFEQQFRSAIEYIPKILTPRPSFPQATDSDIRLLGQQSFSHPSYGTLDPCLLPQTMALDDTTMPENLSTEARRRRAYCAAMMASPAGQRIISQTNLTVPTFLVTWNHALSTHLRLAHFDYNLFNVSILWSNADTREREGYGRAGDGGDVLLWMGLGLEVEWVNSNSAAAQGSGEGLAFRGDFWGEGGVDIRPLTGQGQESAEVWFALD